MRTQYIPKRALAFIFAFMFIGMSASFGLQPTVKEELEEIPSSMNTHSGLNFPGSTLGSIQSLTAIGAAYNYTCVVMDNNNMKCWGRGGSGYLGNGEIADQYTPVSVNMDGITGGAAEFSGAGGHHSCLLSLNGSIYCWGEDSHGQIGHGHWGGSWWSPHGPTTLGGKVAITVVTGLHHSCAIADDMSLYCWGKNDNGQVGIGDLTEEQVYSPREIDLPPGRTAVSINAGIDATCVILDNGSGMCWGLNMNGHLGDGTYNDRTSPTPITVLPANRSLVAMDIGFKHTCGILDDGLVYCWGNNTAGQFGDGTTNHSTYPRAASLPPGRTAISIDAGSHHTCAILDDSSAYCWGRNDNGQLGDGTTNNSTTPVRVSMPSGLGVAEITAGNFHSCAVATNASVYCWGGHGQGALGLGVDVDSDVPAYVDLGIGRHALMGERDNDDDGIVNLFDPFPDGCTPGTYEANGYCLDADPGYYADGVPPYEQFPCSSGTYQPNSGQTDCIDASAGNFVENAGSSAQTTCEAGSYQPDSGQTSCLLADPGNYVSEEASIRQNQCSVGSYQPSSGATECIDTDPGHFVIGFASTEQTPCPPGSYQMLSGATSCFQAGAGFHVPDEGSDSQQQCQSGTYSSQQGQANCTEASPGYFADGLQQTSQSPCQPGEFQYSPGQTSCLETYPGYYTNQGGSVDQNPCEAGSYQPESGQSSCILAESGNYSTAGATSQTQCQNGTYSSESGQAACTPAEPGYYVDLDGAIGATPCPPGQFQTENGSSECETPPPGQVASSDGSTTSACPPGKYQPGEQLNCIEASPGNYVNQSGASSQTQCEAGSFQSQPGQSACELASPGNYADSNGSTSQTPCSKGEYQSFGGQDSCTSAMPGNYVPEAGSQSQTTCKSGNYQPDGGADSCIPADPGSFVSSSAAISQNPCQPGTYQSAEGKIACLPADPDNYVSETGSTEQSKCPSGTDQELTGQTGCIDIERPLWLTILMFGVPAIVVGTMAVLYIANKKKTEGGKRGKAYMYSEDIRK
ncbi:MAG TPA: hypothetical protein EYQ11_04900 [Candidatus Poseidoniales archaeon]|nr:hypothetical protein [Candidatus Poseidoniales archaeon]